MILFTFALIVVEYLLALPAWIFFKKRVRWYRRDYGVPVYGIALWVLLVLLGIGAAPGRENFIVEIFWIFVITVLTPWLRVIWPGSDNKLSLASSNTTISFPLVITLLLRLAMPTLPE